MVAVEDGWVDKHQPRAYESPSLKHMVGKRFCDSYVKEEIDPCMGSYITEIGLYAKAAGGHGGHFYLDSLLGFTSNGMHTDYDKLRESGYVRVTMALDAEFGIEFFGPLTAAQISAIRTAYRKGSGVRKVRIEYSDGAHKTKRVKVEMLEKYLKREVAA